MTTDSRTVPAVLERMALQLPDHDALLSPDRRFIRLIMEEIIPRQGRSGKGGYHTYSRILCRLCNIEQIFRRKRRSFESFVKHKPPSP